MDWAIQLYFIGMIASVIVQYIDFRVNKKGNTKEYRDILAAFDDLRSSLSDLYLSFGAVIGSLVVSVISIIAVIAYLASYPWRLFKILLKLINK
tara:strand:- start:566 stop:847 length:282 start_codon:yes stop_codon:yes gene_type:complete